MKKVLISLAAIAMMMGFSDDLMAQTSASVNNVPAEATIIKTFTLTQTSKLNFARLASSASQAGTCILKGDQTLAPTNVTVSGGTPTVPVFNVEGGFNSTYVITLPISNITITTGTGGVGKTMTINTFKSYNVGSDIASTNNIRTLSSSGTDQFVVGATLNVGQDQIPGTYTGTFTVSVDYN